MGVGRNLAYRKSLFNENHGFVRHLNIPSGDDDLFVNEVAKRHNTRIEVSAGSHTESVPETRLKDWLRQKRRHLSTSSHYKGSSKLMLGLESLSRGLFYGLLVACMIVGGFELRLLAGALFAIRYITQWSVINLTAKYLNERRYYTGILFYDLLLPLISLILLMRPDSGKNQSGLW